MNTLFDLSGKTALVTGASSGLGEHFARILASAGADVVVAARRLDNLQALAADIESLGRKSAAVAMDVTDASSVKTAVQSAVEALGPIHIFCNNAGVVVSKPFLQHNEEDWDHVLDTNLKGAFLAAREVAEHMAEHGQGGSIINTASLLSFRVGKHLSSYVASKGGLMQLTRNMAIELAVHNIRVNALAPGYIETDFNREFFTTAAGHALIKRIPQRRVGQVEDLDGALLLLASDAGCYITGSAINVDGGHAVNSI